MHNRETLSRLAIDYLEAAGQPVRRSQLADFFVSQPKLRIDKASARSIVDGLLKQEMLAVTDDRRVWLHGQPVPLPQETPELSPDKNVESMISDYLSTGVKLGTKGIRRRLDSDGTRVEGEALEDCILAMLSKGQIELEGNLFTSPAGRAALERQRAQQQAAKTEKKRKRKAERKSREKKAATPTVPSVAADLSNVQVVGKGTCQVCGNQSRALNCVRSEWRAAYICDECLEARKGRRPGKSRLWTKVISTPMGGQTRK